MKFRLFSYVINKINERLEKVNNNIRVANLTMSYQSNSNSSLSHFVLQIGWQTWRWSSKSCRLRKEINISVSFLRTSAQSNEAVYKTRNKPLELKNLIHLFK